MSDVLTRDISFEELMSEVESLRKRYPYLGSPISDIYARAEKLSIRHSSFAQNASVRIKALKKKLKAHLESLGKSHETEVLKIFEDFNQDIAEYKSVADGYRRDIVDRERYIAICEQKIDECLEYIDNIRADMGYLEDKIADLNKQIECQKTLLGNAEMSHSEANCFHKVVTKNHEPEKRSYEKSISSQMKISADLMVQLKLLLMKCDEQSKVFKDFRQMHEESVLAAKAKICALESDIDKQYDEAQKEMKKRRATIENQKNYIKELKVSITKHNETIRNQTSELQTLYLIIEAKGQEIQDNAENKAASQQAMHRLENQIDSLQKAAREAKENSHAYQTRSHILIANIVRLERTIEYQRQTIESQAARWRWLKNEPEMNVEDEILEEVAYEARDTINELKEKVADQKKVIESLQKEHGGLGAQNQEARSRCSARSSVARQPGISKEQDTSLTNTTARPDALDACMIPLANASASYDTIARSPSPIASKRPFGLSDNMDKGNDPEAKRRRPGPPTFENSDDSDPEMRTCRVKSTRISPATLWNPSQEFRFFYFGTSHD